MFRKYRKRRQEAAARIMESQSYDIFEYDDTDVELEEDDTCAPDDVLDDVGGAWVVAVDDDDFENKC